MNEALAIVERELQPSTPGLFGDAGPAGIVRQATAIANELKKVIADQKLFTRISGRDHVRVEGWSLLGTMLGVFPVPVSVEPLADGRGYVAHVEARTKRGELVGAAFAICTREESNWKSRDEFALMSMAQTRATGKALRLPLGFVMTLAGYESTPAEEMEVATQPIKVTAPAARPQPKLEAPQRPVGTPATKEQYEDITRLRLILEYSKEDMIKLAADEGINAARMTTADADKIIGILRPMAESVIEGESEPVAGSDE